MYRNCELKSGGVKESYEVAAAAMGVYGVYAQREANTAAAVTTTAAGAHARIDHLSLSVARPREHPHAR